MTVVIKMNWVEIKDKKLRYIEDGQLCSIVGLNEKGETVPLASSRTPLTTTLSSNSSYYRFFKNLMLKELPKGVKLDEGEFSSEIIPEWVEKLIANKVTSEDLSMQNEIQDAEAERKRQKELTEKYIELKAEFDYYLKEYGLNPLQFIVSVARCLCADSVREVIRAFIGFFLTYKEFRATNVIAIGSASAGKSFILETALSMCPQEKVHYGVMTSSAFFREFNGKNLDGWVFYLGDLGGAKDDEKTIAFRDILKQLTTDGRATDTISKDNTDDEVIIREVTGRPAIWYTTAKEEIVNEQEKSRSIILTPQDVDPTSLVIFNTVWENNGSFRDDLIELSKMRESIKGFVYDFRKEECDFFNPYMFCVKDAIEDTDDFNRKIQEFEATLEVVSLLSNPISSTHDLYVDEDNEQKDTRIVFSSKRDNLNAINLFDAINFLPDEARFGDELLARFDLFDLKELESDVLFDDNDSYEDKVMLLLKSEEYGYQPAEANNDIRWKDDYAYNVVNGQCNIKYPFFENNWFTVSSLKKRFGRAKWFKKNREYLRDRLYKLSEEGILLKIGKDGKENVYCLNVGNGSKISEKLPDFSNKTCLEKSRELYGVLFPNSTEDYDLFVENDTEEDTSNLTESIGAMFPDLPYIGGDLDV